MAKTKVYLGDSVYLGPDQWGDNLVLTTENGLGPSNTIALNREVMEKLYNFLHGYLEKAGAPQ